MLSAKVLLDYSDYLKLKEFEKKYHSLKANTEREQHGQGEIATPEQRLEKTILVHENDDELPVQEKQTILDPITTPQAVQDISSRPEKDTGVQKRKSEESAPREGNGDPWYYIGIPKYKK